MFVPLFLLLLLLLTSVSQSKFLYYLSILLLFLSIGLRSIEVGTDTEAYKAMFLSVGPGYNGWPEPLFGYLIELCYSCGLGYTGFLLVISYITLYYFNKSFRNCRINRYHAILYAYLLFFFFYAMNISRQMLAVSIIFYSFTLLYRGKVSKFIIFVCLASMIHTAAIVSLIALVLRKITLNKSLFIICAFGSVCVGLLLNDSLIGMLLGPYKSYLSTSGFGVRESSRLVLSLLLALYFTILSVIITLTIDKSLINTFWFKIYLCGIITNNLTMQLELGLRVVLFFSVTQIIIYTIYIYKNRIKQKFAVRGMLTLYLAIYFLVFILSGSAGVTPYKFIFQ